MKLSLSGRLFESKKGYVLDRDAFLRFAREAGYEGVELRYPQMPVQTPATEVAQVRRQLSDLGLVWVFGTVEGIAEPGVFDRSVTTMKQHVAGGALFTRFTVFKPEQVVLAQGFADEAAAAGATLLMQLHANTMADNVDHALDLLRRIDRPNVKLAYEPNHLLFDGDTRYVDAIDRLAPHIAAVSLQNFKPAAADAPADQRIRIGGRDYVRALPDDPGGVDLPAVFDRLKRIGFSGWATIMCDCIPGMDAKDLSKRWREFLAPLC